MPIIGVDVPSAPHACRVDAAPPDARSVPDWAVWECPICQLWYRAESVRDRGISNLEWVAYTKTNTFRPFALMKPSKFRRKS